MSRSSARQSVAPELRSEQRCATFVQDRGHDLWQAPAGIVANGSLLMTMVLAQSNLISRILVAFVLRFRYQAETVC